MGSLRSGLRRAGSVAVALALGSGLTAIAAAPPASAATAAAPAATAPVASSVASPVARQVAAARARMASSRAVRVQTVCFTVRVPGDRTTEQLYGLRYSVGGLRPSTPAVLLVHGIASSTANWDFTPRWSVARSLARTGYTVISYDQLGFAKSPYHRVNGGSRLTAHDEQVMLHQVLQSVRTGSYTTTTAAGCADAARRTPSTLRSPRVVLVGHSYGAGLVEGYEGTYRDAAAVVQADLGLASRPAPPPHPVTAPPPATNYFAFFPNGRAQCQAFNFYTPGAQPGLAKIACNPADFVLSPTGVFRDFGTTFTAAAYRAIDRGGPAPHLITYGDHDVLGPGNEHRDFLYWRSHCHCVVSEYVQPDSGHLFMAHRSLTQWLDVVVGWLVRHGLTPIA